MEEVLSTGYPIFSCFEHQSSVVASSWFYIHGLSDERVWKVEHQGMPPCFAAIPHRMLFSLQGMTKTITLSLNPSVALTSRARLWKRIRQN